MNKRTPLPSLLGERGDADVVESLLSGGLLTAWFISAPVACIAMVRFLNLSFIIHYMGRLIVPTSYFHFRGSSYISDQGPRSHKSQPPSKKKKHYDQLFPIIQFSYEKTKVLNLS